jgi:hypothetical protein
MHAAAAANHDALDPAIIRVDIPASATDDEHEAALSVAAAISPTRREPLTTAEFMARKPLPPDSPLIDVLLGLSRALWQGEPYTVQTPEPTDDAHRQALAELARAVDPSDSPSFRETGVGAALADLAYHLNAALWGTTPNRVRCLAILDDALFDVMHLANVGRSDDQPLMWAYRAALVGDDARGYDDLSALRERFRRAVRDAEQAMDRADREIADEDTDALGQNR